MAQPKVIVEINEDGTEFSVNVEGVAGKSCDRIQKDLSGSGKLKRATIKPEFYQAGTATQTYARR